MKWFKLDCGERINLTKVTNYGHGGVSLVNGLQFATTDEDERRMDEAVWEEDGPIYIPVPMADASHR